MRPTANSPAHKKRPHQIATDGTIQLITLLENVSFFPPNTNDCQCQKYNAEKHGNLIPKFKKRMKMGIHVDGKTRDRRKRPVAEAVRIYLTSTIKEKYHLEGNPHCNRLRDCQHQQQNSEIVRNRLLLHFDFFESVTINPAKSLASDAGERCRSCEEPQNESARPEYPLRCGLGERSRDTARRDSSRGKQRRRLAFCR